MENHGMSKSKVTRRVIECLPISPLSMIKCLSNGFYTVDDLENVSASELSQKTDMTLHDANEVIKQSLSNNHEFICKQISAKALYEAECPSNYITTLCPGLDKALKGGIALGKIIEICGIPGIGKTQIGIQLCFTVQILQGKDMRNIARSAIFIDTEGSFDHVRAAMIGESMQELLIKLAEKYNKPNLAENLNLDNMMSNIHYFRVEEMIKLLSIVNTLPDMIKSNPTIKLIVVDSFAFLFRQEFPDMRIRTRLTTSIANQLAEMAEKYNIAVVLSNQVTTRIDGLKDAIIPTLGDNWAQCVNTRLCLTWENGQRVAIIQKSPFLDKHLIPFSISPQGLRSIKNK